MASTSRHTVETRYHAAEIVLSGAYQDVHSEARKIVRRFANSASPYYVAEDRGEYIKLRRGDLMEEL